MPCSLSKTQVGIRREALGERPLILLLRTLRTRIQHPLSFVTCQGVCLATSLGPELGQVQEGKSSGRDLGKHWCSGEEARAGGTSLGQSLKPLRFPYPKKSQARIPLFGGPNLSPSLCFCALLAPIPPVALVWLSSHRASFYSALAESCPPTTTLFLFLTTLSLA